jgi:hypothetical protein
MNSPNRSPNKKGALPIDAQSIGKTPLSDESDRRWPDHAIT